MHKRWFKAFLKVLAVLTVLLVLFLIVERVRGQVSFARYTKALAAKGEKLAVRDLQSSVPDAENAAPMVYDAIERLTNGVVLPNDYPPCMKLMLSGRAIVGFREVEWVEGKKTNRWEQVALDLKPNEAVLAATRSLLAKPSFDNKLDYSQGFKMRFSNVVPPKHLTRWFGGAAQVALCDGRLQDALDNLEAQICIPRLLAEDRVVISELVRIAIAAIARGTTWEALQAEGWNNEQLARLQQAWEEQSFAASMARSLEGERIFSDVSSEMVRASNEDAIVALFWQEDYALAAGFIGGDDPERPAWNRLVNCLPYGEQIANFLKKQVYCRVWRFAWSHQDQRHDLETMQRLIEATRAATTNKSSVDLQNVVAEIGKESGDRNLYDRLRFPGADSAATVAGSVSKALRAETDRSMTICAIALKRYSLRHGKLPASLDALVPEFVSAVPLDYMDGTPLRYRLNANGGFTLYSVGENLVDDGGDASALPDHAGSRNLWFKKDYIWPAPATPEEVAAYREEARKR